MLALRQALLSRGFHPGILQGFDLTPKMLEDFRQTLRMRAIEGVKVVQADVLQLDTLPAGWNDFDLIVSAAMMEYVPRKSLVDALSGLRSRLNEAGSVLLFITRRTCIACHGANGKGTIPGVTDLTDVEGALSKPDEELLKSISEEFQSPGSMLAMPPKGGNPTLTEEGEKAVLAYLRTQFGRSGSSSR